MNNLDKEMKELKTLKKVLTNIEKEYNETKQKIEVQELELKKSKKEVEAAKLLAGGCESDVDLIETHIKTEEKKIKKERKQLDKQESCLEKPKNKAKELEKNLGDLETEKLSILEKVVSKKEMKELKEA